MYHNITQNKQPYVSAAYLARSAPAAISSNPHNARFTHTQPCGFTNVDGTQPWRHNSGGTPSSSTGPEEGNSHDIDPTHPCYGQSLSCTISDSGAGDYYMYTEASSNTPGVTFSLESPDLPTAGVADGLLLTFYYVSQLGRCTHSVYLH